MTNNDVAMIIKRLQGRTAKLGKALEDIADKADKLEQRLRNTEQAQAKANRALASRRRRLVAWALLILTCIGVGMVLGFAAV